MNRLSVIVVLVAVSTGILAGPIFTPSSSSKSSGSEEVSSESYKQPIDLVDNGNADNSTATINRTEIDRESLENYDNITIVRDVLKFLQTYDYFTKEENIDELADDKVRMVIKEPLIKFKEFFGLTPLDATIDDDVLEVTHKPRCGDADLSDEEDNTRKKRFVRGGSPWPVERLTMSIVRYHTKQPQLTNQIQDEIMHTCARIWAEKSGLNIEIRRGWAHVMLQFRSIDGRGGQIANSEMPNGKIDTLLPIKLDIEENWAQDNWHRTGNDVGLLWAVCHEIGHALGLNHVRDRNQIMYPLAQRVGNRDHTLGADDIRGIQALYGPPSRDGVKLTNTVLGANYVERPRGPSKTAQAKAPTTRRTTRRTTTTTTQRPTTTTRKPTTIPSPTTQKTTTTTTQRPTTTTRKPTTTPSPTTERTTSIVASPISRSLASFRARFSYLF